MVYRYLYYFMLLTAIVTTMSISPAAAGTPVFVSILPQKYFVEKIGKGLVDVHVMVPPGAGPATYEPRPAQMAALAGARIYFAVGVPFERAWLARIAAANPAMTIVHTDEGIAKIPMAAHHHHEAGSGDPHGHDGPLDPHVWLSPPLVKIQARRILSALAAADPENEAVFAANCDAFLGEVDALHRDLLAVFRDRRGEAFMVFHPSWGYFAKTYGLRQIAIETEGKDPKPAQLKDLIETARAMGVRVVFVQPQFSAKSARVIAGAIGGEVIFADPLAEDWAENLRAQAVKFSEALKARE